MKKGKIILAVITLLSIDTGILNAYSGARSIQIPVAIK